MYYLENPFTSCWDFEMSQMESGVNFIMRKVIQVVVSLLEPRKLGPS